MYCVFHIYFAISYGYSGHFSVRGVCCIDSCLVLIGNAMLLRVLPSVYPRHPEPIHHRIRELTAMMSHLDQAGRQHLLRLLQMISDLHPLVSEETNERVNG